MDKLDIMLTALEPEIDRKCLEIRQRKSERMLTRLFIMITAAVLIIPVLLVFLGVGLMTVFAVIIAVAAIT